jgi:hypothetical protein
MIPVFIGVNYFEYLKFLMIWAIQIIKVIFKVYYNVY